MKFMLLSLFAFSFIFVSCGEVEKEELPGKNNKGLSDGQKQQGSQVLGALGDLHNVIQWIGDINAPFTGRAVNRTIFRRQLQRSMRLQNCTTQTQGSLDFGKFDLGVYGGNCPIEVDYKQNQRIFTDTNTSKVVLFQFQTSYSSQTSEVKTDVSKMEMSGEYREVDELKDKFVITKRESDIEMSGRSKSAGQLKYRLEERFVKTQEQGSVDSNGLYTRTDDLLSLNSYQITLFKKIEFKNDKATLKNFFINGTAIPESEYEDLLQGLDKEWGNEGFAKP